jgi:hypothetical protein
MCTLFKIKSSTGIAVLTVQNKIIQLKEKPPDDQLVRSLASCTDGRGFTIERLLKSVTQRTDSNARTIQGLASRRGNWG